MQFTSNPTSELNMARINYRAALDALSRANRSRDREAINIALAFLSHTRAHLKRVADREAGKPPKRFDPLFNTTVRGIPCGVVVLSIEPPDPSVGMFEPSYEVILVDRKGYRAQWLWNKMNNDDWGELINEIEAHYRG